MIQCCHSGSAAQSPPRAAEEGSFAPAASAPIHVPRRTAATLALMQMGIHDYPTLASVVGLTEQEVKHIDMATDPQVRELGVQGIPFGEYFHLRRRVRCPTCFAWITVAPCVACQVRAAQRAEVKEHLPRGRRRETAGCRSRRAVAKTGPAGGSARSDG